MRLQALPIIAMMFLAACGGRSPQLMQATQLRDDRMSCDAIQREIDANNMRISQLTGQQAETKSKNIGLGVVSVLIFPVGLLALDLTDAEQKEIEAINTRQQVLGNLEVEACRPAKKVTK